MIRHEAGPLRDHYGPLVCAGRHSQNPVLAAVSFESDFDYPIVAIGVLASRLLQLSQRSEGGLQLGSGSSSSWMASSAAATLCALSLLSDRDPESVGAIDRSRCQRPVLNTTCGKTRSDNASKTKRKRRHFIDEYEAELCGSALAVLVPLRAQCRF